mmetsp:Transcript_15339/g.52034  ORF Transcript_15339/g.52034 Transcript_15339/m.52034 type:complete len:282 (+) Transcript_15339:346-1191(+)
MTRMQLMGAVCTPVATAARSSDRHTRSPTTAEASRHSTSAPPRCPVTPTAPSSCHSAHDTTAPHVAGGSSAARMDAAASSSPLMLHSVTSVGVTASTLPFTRDTPTSSTRSPLPRAKRAWRHVPRHSDQTTTEPSSAPDTSTPLSTQSSTHVTGAPWDAKVCAGSSLLARDFLETRHVRRVPSAQPVASTPPSGDVAEHVTTAEWRRSCWDAMRSSTGWRCVASATRNCTPLLGSPHRTNFWCVGPWRRQPSPTATTRSPRASRTSPMGSPRDPEGSDTSW